MEPAAAATNAQLLLRGVMTVVARSNSWFPLVLPALLRAGFAVAIAGCTEATAEFVLPAGYGDGLTGRAFKIGATNHTLIDLQTEELRLTFDVARQTTLGHAEVHFRPVETGEPFFLLTPTARTARLDRRPVTLATLRDPDDVVTLTTIGVELTAGTDHVLEIDYPLATTGAAGSGYSTTGVDFETAMVDVAGTDAPANLFEAYGPAGIEADQFQLSVELELVGATAPHRLFSNGVQQAVSPGQWTIVFPDYYSTSSFYFQLTEWPFVVREATYHGLERDLPITAYALDGDAADQAIGYLPGYLADLEASFGPYPHASFVAAITSGLGPSTAYAGATRAAMADLSRELCHSWFGRGVLPADGRSGWIDDGIAFWRERKYQATPDHGPRAPTNLSQFSIWQQATVANPDFAGSAVLSDIDAMLGDRGGLRPILRALYARWQHRPITTEQFLGFLETESGLSLDTYFQEYVYGKPAAR